MILSAPNCEEAVVLVLSAADIVSVLDLDQLVDVLQAAMVDLSEGRASMPPRVGANVPERNGLLAAMPAFLPSASALTTKLVTLFPRNQDRPTHQALICCFDPENGTPTAMMDGTYVTATRTAAGSALATRLLARPGAEVVAVIGTGVQARTHAQALARRTGVRVVRIAGRDQRKVQTLVDELVASGVSAEAAPSIEDAVRSADVVCAATHSEQPVVRRDWLAPGTHVNSVGYNTAGEGEVDTATICDAVVVVESRSAALAAPPSGAVELRWAIEQGVINTDHIAAEIGELAAGKAKGRTDDDQLTLYKSVGVAVQDAAAAALILETAQQRGIGTHVAI
jgi:ornithine cyclodeaminase/alanine dehydrogenase-like protein (mu-crystallin family)